MADIILKNRSGTDVTYTGVKTIQVPKADGTKEDFINPQGNINITDTQITDVRGKATAQVVDANLKAENIAKDVTVLGITGTHEGGGGGEFPQLHAPTISIDEDTLTITNSSNNGDFVTGYKILNNGAEVATVTDTTVDLTAVFTEANDYTVTVKAIGTNFADSEDSNAVAYTNIYYSVTYNLTNCTSNNTATSVRKGSSYVSTIKADNGFKLGGATVTITMGETDICSAYSNGTISIASVSDDVSIAIVAVVDNKLNWTKMDSPSKLDSAARMMFDTTSNTAYFMADQTGISILGSFYGAKTTNFTEINGLSGSTAPTNASTIGGFIAANGNIIVADVKYIYVSNDEMKTWSKYSMSGVSNVGYGVYGNGKYVLIVRYNRTVSVCWSTDAVNWTKTNIYLSNSWTTPSISFCNNKFFIIAAKDNAIYCSSDGINYSESNTVTLPFSSYYTGASPIAYGDGKYVIKGLNQQYITSTDGINWVAQNAITDTNCYFDIAYGNGKFVAVWNEYEDRIKDGETTWEQSTADISKSHSKGLWFIGNRFISGIGYYSDVV